MTLAGGERSARTDILATSEKETSFTQSRALGTAAPLSRRGCAVLLTQHRSLCPPLDGGQAAEVCGAGPLGA